MNSFKYPWIRSFGPVVMLLAMFLVIFAAVGCGGDKPDASGPVPEESPADVATQPSEETVAPDAGNPEPGSGATPGDPTASSDGPMTLSNQDFASRLAAAVSLAPKNPPNTSAEEKEAFLDRVRVSVIAQSAEIFPDLVEMRSHKVLDALLTEPLVVGDPTDEAARLHVRQWLYECHYKLANAERIPPVSPEDEKALIENVNALWAGLEPLLYSELKGHLSEKYIKLTLQETKAENLALVTDPTTPLYKHPVSDEQIAAIIEDFANMEEQDPQEYYRAMAAVDEFTGPNAIPIMKITLNDFSGTMLGRQLILRSIETLSQMTREGEMGDLKVQMLHPDYEEVKKERFALLDEFNKEKKRRREGTSDEKIVL